MITMPETPSAKRIHQTYSMVPASKLEPMTCAASIFIEARSARELCNNICSWDAEELTRANVLQAISHRVKNHTVYGWAWRAVHVVEMANAVWEASK